MPPESPFPTVRLGGVCTKIGSGATPRGGSDVYMASGVASLIRSQNIHNNRFLKEGLAYLGQQHADELDNVAVEAGDVLLNITGDSVARCTQAPKWVLPARVNQHVAIIRPERLKLDSRFLRYFLVSPGMQAQMLTLAGAGATRNALTKGMIEDFQIPLPPIKTQLRIAEILGTLDDKIELNMRLNETLEAMTRALFKSWFIDFVPVDENIAGRVPLGLDRNTVELFPDTFEDSILGRLPQGWVVGALDNLAEILMGSSPPGDTYNDSGVGIPLVNGPVEFGDYFTVKKKWTTEPTRTCQTGDLIFCVRGSTTGRRVIADDVYCLGRGVCAIRSRHDANGFIYCLVEFNLDRLLSKASGSVFPNLNGPDIKQLQIAQPPVPLIRAYQRAVEPILKRIWLHAQEAENLAATRETLLPKLLSGEVAVEA